jgi:hypothetical protein
MCIIAFGHAFLIIHASFHPTNLPNGCQFFLFMLNIDLIGHIALLAPIMRTEHGDEKATG